MRDRVVYEYVIELKDEFGDIANILFYNDIKYFYANQPQDKNYDIALVRTTGNDNEGVKDKSYAYFHDGKLPLQFDDGIKVPQKYLNQIAPTGENGELAK